MKNRYRYITNGSVKPSDKICDYRLIGGNQLKQSDGRNATVVRVRIPDDMKLTKYSCDNYSTTEDTRTLEELGCDYMVRINGKYIFRNDLKTMPIHDVHNVISDEGYFITTDGYLDRKTYSKWWDDRQNKKAELKKRVKAFKKELDSIKSPMYLSSIEQSDHDFLVELVKQYVAEKTGKDIR